MQGLMARLVAFKQLEFFARYGDYLAIMCQNLKTKSHVNETFNHEQFSGWNNYWTDINRRLKEEPWKEFLTGELADRDLVKTHLAVNDASGLIGLDSESTMDLIGQYAQRNELMHLSIDVYIQRGKFSDLAVNLATDLKQLPVVIPPYLSHLESLYHALICSVIEENYTIIDMENPHTRIPKATLAKVYMSMKRKEESAAEEAKKLREKVLKTAEARFEGKVKARVLIMRVALLRAESRDPLRIGSPSSAFKRKARGRMTIPL